MWSKDEKKNTNTTGKVTEVKTLDQLKEELVTLRNDYRESQRSHRQGELVNPHILTTQRKAIARTLTAIKQAGVAAAKEEN
jgi:ribosomal protein L29